MAGGLAVRRRFPVTTLAIVLLGFVALLQIGGTEFDSNIAGPFFWMLFASYTVGAYTEGRHLAFGAFVGVALNVLATATDPYDNDITAFVNSVALGVAAPMLFATVMRNRARLNTALREKAQQLADSRDGAAESAALDERTRIAGELHDVVAHALSAMTVQAAAARRLAERNPMHAAGRVRDRRGDRPRGAHGAPPPARRPAPRGRGHRARAAAEPRPHRLARASLHDAAGCRSSCASRASRARCRPAST